MVDVTSNGDEVMSSLRPYHHTPCLGLLGKEGFCLGPSVFEEGGEAVMVEVGLGKPVAVGEEDGGVVAVLPQLEVGAAFKIPYGLFPLIKERGEGRNAVGPEGHLYDTDNHSNWIFMSLSLLPSLKPKRLAALPRLMHISICPALLKRHSL